MSVTYCHYCDQHIDLDFDTDHFETNKNRDSLDYCVFEESDKVILGQTDSKLKTVKRK